MKIRVRRIQSKQVFVIEKRNWFGGWKTCACVYWGDKPLNSSGLWLENLAFISESEAEKKAILFVKALFHKDEIVFTMSN